MDGFSTFLASIRWQDLLDIALNSYILFRVYVLLRGTHVLRMIIGLVCLWLFQRVAVSAGLIVTSWVTQGITAVAALVIIVVFSSEIRSMFQTRSLKAIFWGIPTQAFTSSIETISESAFDMAKKHCGALVVIPGKKSIRGVIQNGLPWKGLVSREMILSIFWHNNPVHDGAIVIQGDQVSEVGAILPLSQRRDLPKYYGTRHRAAMGLTEVTDALVIVVSEERGVVVAAKNRHLSVMHSRADLEETLRRHMGVASETKNGPSRQRLKIGAAALASVVFIFSVWFLLTRGLTTLVTLDIPVKYVELDPGMEIVSTSVSTVRLHLSGSQLLLESIQPNQVQVQIDLSTATAGYNVFPINAASITLPPGILLTKVEPRAVEMEIDTYLTLTFPVQVDWAGKLDENLILTSATTIPETVRLRGNSRALNQIDTIYTEKARLEPIRQSGTVSLGLAISHLPVAVASGSADTLQVAYTVTPRTPPDAEATADQ